MSTTNFHVKNMLLKRWYMEDYEIRDNVLKERNVSTCRPLVFFACHGSYWSEASLFLTSRQPLFPDSSVTIDCNEAVGRNRMGCTVIPVLKRGVLHSEYGVFVHALKLKHLDMW